MISWTWARSAITPALLLLPLAVAAQQDPAAVLGGLLQGLMRGSATGAAGTPKRPATLATGSASNGPTVDLGQLLSLLNQSLESIDEPKEQEIGRHLAAILLGAKPLLNNPALQQYVARMGRWISLQSGRPHLAWTFGVLDDPGYNAFAAPGGFVFVTRGLVERMRDESELAAVLAHEISHVVHKHHLKALKTNAQAGLLAQLLSSQIDRQRDSHGLQHQLLALGREVYARGLDQADELDADRQGVALATASGFDPYGLPQVLQQLSTIAPDHPAFSLTLGTHPAPALRLAQLEQAMGTPLESYASVPPRPLPPLSATPPARP
ncbi:MAG: M48 family metalloprotease [Rhodoferax sp.]